MEDNLIKYLESLEKDDFCASVRGGGTAGPIWAFFLGCVVASVTSLLVYLAWCKYNDNKSLCRQAASCSEFSDAVMNKIFSPSRGGLPPWLKSPGFNNPKFVNTAMQILWPKIDKAGVEWAFKDRKLEKMLNSMDFWKPKWLAASGVVLQSVVLGQVPPNVTDIKVYPRDQGSTNNALVADIAFSWNSKMEIKLAMKTLDDVGSKSLVDKILSFVYRTVSIKVVVRDLVARGHIRVIAGPLSNSLPIVEAARLCFLEPPAMSYDVSSSIML